ncbi:hypothetical protein ES705_37746 [subsurface metagenome]|nr:hypothetical protein [Methanosarcinales archaeon]
MYKLMEKEGKEEEKTAEDLVIIGEEYLAEKKYEEAIEVYKEIVGKEPILPTLAKVCNDCGVAYASLEQYEMAIGFFNAALNLREYLMDEGISACYDEEKAEEYFKRAEMTQQAHKRRDEEAQRIFSSER